MTPRPGHPVLARYAECFDALEWSVMILDTDWRLEWVSDELRQFVAASDESDVGCGLHVVEAMAKDPWLSAMSPDSFPSLFANVGPYCLYALNRHGLTAEDVLPAELTVFLEGLEPVAPPDIFRTRFLAIDPADPDLPPYPVNVCALHLRDERGDSVGWVGVMFLGVRPNLLTLLARGDEEMYERMARLVEPRPRQGAILFCDVHSSGKLSRQLPSITYFRLIRSLWTGIDQSVADNTGIVGKHAGDGGSAFFLVDDLGTRSRAAAAAVKTAARIHEISEEVFAGVVDGACPMRIGLHWGGSLYMGQLVPGGRLDVSALGDEVNEAARIQEAAGAGETIVSKQFLEQLSADDAAGLGIDLEKISYRLLSEVAPEESKAVRDAGALPVTSL